MRILFITLAIICLCGFRVPGFNNPKQGQQEHYKAAYEPKHIALLLPLSGKHAEAGRAIKEGFLASYYENAFLGAQKPVVRVYDTAKETNVQKIYLFAIQEGADFVVGPLTKDDVLRLSQLSSRSLKAPILALNYHPQAKTLPGKFVQFPLLPETDAEQLAEKAWQSGQRRAGILAANTPMGHRVTNAFTTRFQSLGGKVTQTVFVEPQEDQSLAVCRLLGITPKQDLKEDPPHPTFDFVMMTADPIQARQLRPLLNFYYAEKIPVYATSSVYSGEPDPMTDHDLNGVIFCEMPWLVNPARNPNLVSTTPDKRLFALGADAYQLITQIGLLQAGQTYPGMTGNLSLTNQHIQRQLMFVKMVNGTPKQI